MGRRDFYYISSRDLIQRWTAFLCETISRILGAGENMNLLLIRHRSESVSIDDDFTALQCPFWSALYRFGRE